MNTAIAVFFFCLLIPMVKGYLYFCTIRYDIITGKLVEKKEADNAYIFRKNKYY